MKTWLVGIYKELSHTVWVWIFLRTLCDRQDMQISILQADTVPERLHLDMSFSIPCESSVGVPCFLVYLRKPTESPRSHLKVFFFYLSLNLRRANQPPAFFLLSQNRQHLPNKKHTPRSYCLYITHTSDWHWLS